MGKTPSSHIIHSLGGEYCWIVRDSEPIRLLKSPKSLSVYILIDVSEAFDTVDHGILLEALYKLKLEGRVFEWFWSYFSGRCQRISVRGCQCRSFNENCGVPQGSFLGPLLFTIHTSSLRDVVQDYLPSIHCYGDDNQIYASFSPADETDHPAIAAFEGCIQVISNWMHVW